MSTASKPRITPEEYLQQERKAEFKSEYFDGEVFAMSGASRRHVVITKNVTVALDRRLGGRSCETYGSDMRVRVSATGLYTYPDVTVACGDEQFLDNETDTLLNPVLIVEVLSPTTKNYDRGDKFAGYRTISSFREHLTIAQDRVHVEQYPALGRRTLGIKRVLRHHREASARLSRYLNPVNRNLSKSVANVKPYLSRLWFYLTGPLLLVSACQ